MFVGLNRATGVCFARDGIPNTSACLICTNTIREIIIECTKCIGAITAHPSTPCTCCNCKLDTCIHGRNTNMGVVFMGCNSHAVTTGCKECKECEKCANHCIYRLLCHSFLDSTCSQFFISCSCRKQNNNHNHGSVI